MFRNLLRVRHRYSSSFQSPESAEGSDRCNAQPAIRAQRHGDAGTSDFASAIDRLMSIARMISSVTLYHLAF